jgi:hypothetical protein
VHLLREGTAVALAQSERFQVSTLHKNVVRSLLVPVILSRSPVVQALSDQGHHVGLRGGEEESAVGK